MLLVLGIVVFRVVLVKWKINLFIDGIIKDKKLFILLKNVLYWCVI